MCYVSSNEDNNLIMLTYVTFEASTDKDGLACNSPEEQMVHGKHFWCL